MFILYALMEFGSVRFNEMQRYIGTVTYNTLSSAHKQLETGAIFKDSTGARSSTGAYFSGSCS